MRYAGIEESALEDVRRLNARFLAAMSTRPSVAIGGLSKTVDADTLNWFTGATSRELSHIAATPFFLYRLDDIGTDPSAAVTPELFGRSNEPENEALLLGLSFAWQLSRRDLFSVRVLTGASTDWCAWLADVPFSSLAEVVRSNSGPLTPNLIDAAFFWPGLLEAVRNGNARHVTAVQSAGLQHLLRRQSSERALPVAARKLDTPERRVADKGC